VVLTQTEGSDPGRDAKGSGAGQRGKVLGKGLAGTAVATVLSVALLSWPVAALVLVVGIVATVLMTARAVAVPGDSGNRFQQLQQRLEGAEIPDTARREIQGALDRLAASQERQLAVKSSIDQTLRSLGAPGLDRSLVTAETGGDPEEIALRRQAVDAHADLAAQRDGLQRGLARTAAALDALELALAQAGTSSTPEVGSLESTSRQLLDQVDALRRATAELDALDDGRDPPPRSRERA
jgi:hypothetical protein